MAKNFREIIENEPELHEMRRLRTPDIMTEKFSDWTYEDMKLEFQKSKELFAENGFEDGCAGLAYGSIGLSLFYGENTERAYAMTENIMALTVLFNTALAVSRIHPYLIDNYKQFVSEYRNSPTHGLILSPEEQAELDRDIESALEKLRGYSSEPPKRFERKFLSTREIRIDGWELGYKWREENFTNTDPPADGDCRMKARLSDSAYEMMTEFERGKMTSPDKYEKTFLLPNGLKMTDKLREFFEIYDGRVFAWRKSPDFSMNAPWSQTPFWGYSMGCGGRILVSDDGTYYIEAMNEHTTQDHGPHIGSDGKVYGCVMGCLYFLTDSVEKFLESEARERFKDQLLLKRRRELENKYLIPEIRTASM